MSKKEESSQTAKIISSYNNPIRERLVLNLERNISPKITFQIHDLRGQLLYQNVFDVKQGSVEISMATFASGLYFVTCLDDRNTIKETIKVLKYSKGVVFTVNPSPVSNDITLICPVDFFRIVFISTACFARN